MQTATVSNFDIFDDSFLYDIVWMSSVGVKRSEEFEDAKGE